MIEIILAALTLMTFMFIVSLMFWLDYTTVRTGDTRWKVIGRFSLTIGFLVFASVVVYNAAN